MNPANVQKIVRQIQSMETKNDLEIFSLVLNNAIKDRIQKMEKDGNPKILRYR